MDGNFARLAKNGSALFLANSTGALFEIGQIAVLTRVLTADGYGLLCVVIAAAGLVNQFIDVRVREVTVRFGSQFLASGQKEHFGAIIKLGYAIDVLIALVTSSLLFFSANWIGGEILGKSDAGGLLRIYAACALFGAFKGTNQSVLLITEKIRWLSRYNALMPAIEFCVVSGIALFVGKVQWVIAGLVALEALRALISLSLGVKALAGVRALKQIIASPLALLKARRREITSMLVHTNFMAYFRMINTKVDFVVLGAYWPTADVALYRVARSLSAAVGRFSDPFFTALLPNISKLYAEGKHRECRQLLLRCWFAMSAMMGAVALIITLLSEPIVVLVSGEQYRPAGSLLSGAVWAFAIGGAFFWTWPASIAIGRADLGTKVGLFSSGVQLACLFVAVPLWGAWGAVIALIGAYLASQPLLAFLIMRSLARSERNPVVRSDEGLATPV
jgi:O-antigen/teichoic acid export membrane protein